jgi:hypothetical protein
LACHAVRQGLCSQAFGVPHSGDPACACLVCAYLGRLQRLEDANQQGARSSVTSATSQGGGGSKRASEQSSAAALPDKANQNLGVDGAACITFKAGAVPGYSSDGTPFARKALGPATSGSGVAWAAPSEAGVAAAGSPRMPVPLALAGGPLRGSASGLTAAAAASGRAPGANEPAPRTGLAGLARRLWWAIQRGREVLRHVAARVWTYLWDGPEDGEDGTGAARGSGGAGAYETEVWSRAGSNGGCSCLWPLREGQQRRLGGAYAA